MSYLRTTGGLIWVRRGTHKELKREVQRRQVFPPLHDFACTFLVKARLSAESSRYYASLVKFYAVTKLKRMQPGAARLYLCASRTSACGGSTTT